MTEEQIKAKIEELTRELQFVKRQAPREFKISREIALLLMQLKSLPPLK